MSWGITPTTVTTLLFTLIGRPRIHRPPRTGSATRRSRASPRAPRPAVVLVGEVPTRMGRSLERPEEVPGHVGSGDLLRYPLVVTHVDLELRSAARLWRSGSDAPVSLVGYDAPICWPVLVLVQTAMMRSGSWKGRPRRKTAFTNVKTVVFAPIPNDEGRDRREREPTSLDQPAGGVTNVLPQVHVAPPQGLEGAARARRNLHAPTGARPRRFQMPPR